MKTLYEIRRENLRTLVQERGNSEVAKAAGYKSPSYLSQMIGRKAIRPVTEDTARRVEVGLHLPHLSLDQERDPYGRPVAGSGRREHDNEPLSMVSPDQFSNCATIVSNEMVAAGVKTTADKFAVIVGLLINSPDQSDDGLHALAAQLVKISA